MFTSRSNSAKSPAGVKIRCGALPAPPPQGGGKPTLCGGEQKAKGLADFARKKAGTIPVPAASMFTSRSNSAKSPAGVKIRCGALPAPPPQGGGKPTLCGGEQKAKGLADFARKKAGTIPVPAASMFTSRSNSAKSPAGVKIRCGALPAPPPQGGGKLLTAPIRQTSSAPPAAWWRKTTLCGGEQSKKHFADFARKKAGTIPVPAASMFTSRSNPRKLPPAGAFLRKAPLYPAQI